MLARKSEPVVIPPIPPDNLVLAENVNTNSSGVYTRTVPEAGLVYQVLPRTDGDYSVRAVVSGSTLTVTCRRFKSGGLGLTVGTLLSGSIFEDTNGIVNIDVYGCRPRSA